MARAFLPKEEQELYDSIVDGLRRQGWGRYSAQAEAIARIDVMRTKAGRENAGETTSQTDADSTP